MFAADDDPSEIAALNPNAPDFVGPSGGLTSSPGPRLFGSHDRGLFRVIRTLNEDLGSRRAVVPLLTEDDLVLDGPNTPCFQGISFLVVDGDLDCIVTMRSQSAFKVLPYDLFVLTQLHELVAVATGLPIGRYHHFMASAHIYEDELAQATEFADGALHPLGAQRMQPVDRFEGSLVRDLQLGRVQRHGIDVEATPYWRSYVRAFLRSQNKLATVDDALRGLAVGSCE